MAFFISLKLLIMIDQRVINFNRSAAGIDFNPSTAGTISVNQIITFKQGSTLTVARLPGATNFRRGQVKNYRQWAISSICSIFNVSDCHNRHRMSVASWASDKFVGGKCPKKFLALRFNSVSV